MFVLCVLTNLPVPILSVAVHRLLVEMFNPTNYAITPHSVGPWVGGVLIAVLGVAVLVRERGSRVSLALCLLALSCAIWLLSAGTLYSTLHEPLALWWAKAEHFGVVFIPSLLLIFTLAFVQRVHEFRAVAWGSLVVSGLLYVSVLATDRFITGVYHYAWGYYPRYGPLSLPFLVFFFSLLLGSIRFLWIEHTRAVHGIPRHRVKALLIALGIGYLGAVDFLGAYGIPFYPFGYVAVLGFVALMFVAVWRYRLLEITPALAAEQIINTMADALLVLDHEGTVRAANQAAFQLFGYPKAEIVGKPIAATLGNLFGKETLKALADTGVMREYETDYCTQQGKILTLDIMGSVTRDLVGYPLAFVFITRDVTERKEAEEALRKAKTELAHVTRVMTMGEMVASIAHEITQPLTAVLTNGQACLRWLARESPNLDEAREAVRHIIQDGSRAGEVIQRIRALAKKTESESAWLDINGVIHEVIDLTHSEILRNQVVLRTDLVDGLPAVLGDRIQLQQVLLNLVINAIEAMSTVEYRRRELLVTSHRDESDWVVVSVCDSGVGLHSQEIDRLFDAYYTTKPHGLGMGLSISRSIIQAHSGRLWATANDGRGATVHFALPTVLSRVP